MAAFIRVEGPQRAVYLFDTRLVGVNADNGKKFLFTLALIAILLLLGWLLRVLTRATLRGSSNERAIFWTRQGIRLFIGVFLVFGVASIWFDDPTTLTTALGLVTAGLAFALQKVVTAFAGYIVILRGKTFNVGDRIAMGGVRGDVIALGFTQTTIMEMGQPPAVQGANPALARQTPQRLERVADVGRLQEKVRERGYIRTQPHPAGGQPHRVGAARPQPALVVVGQELRLVGRHVYRNRTVAFAPLARQAQVERVLDGLVLPPVPQHLAAHHLEQEVRPAAGRVPLLPRRHEARAHRPALQPPALADPEAALGPLREPSLVFREPEMRVDLPRVVVGAVSEVRRQRVGVDQLPRIHLPLGIPDALELVERLHQFRAEHLREQLPLRLAVAVFTGQRAPVGHHQVGRVVHERPILPHPFRRPGVEGDARVDAALPEVAVQGVVVPVPVQQLREVAEVVAQLLGGHRRVLPAREGVLDVRHPAGPDARLAELPHRLLLPGIGQHFDARADIAVGSKFPFRLLGPAGNLLRGVAAEFDQEPGIPLRDQVHARHCAALPPHVLDHVAGERLQRDRVRFQDRRNVVAGLPRIGIADHEERSVPRAWHQPHAGAQDQHAGALGSDEGAGDMEAVLGQQRIKVVARDSTRDVRIAGANAFGMLMRSFFRRR